MNKVDSPFFLAIKHKQVPDDNTWYMKCPLGKNQIGKFPSTAAKNAGLPQVSGAKVTNHSVRKTSISRLLDADMPENFVAQHSGHKSTESLQSYKSAGKKQQWQMSWVLSRVSSITQPCQLCLVLLPVFCKCVSQTIKPHVHLSTQQTNLETTRRIPRFSQVFIAVQGCSFQIFDGQVNFNLQNKHRCVIIESDEED